MVKKEVEREISLPEGFQALLDGNQVVIKGNGKQAERRFNAKGVSLSLGQSSLRVVGRPASRKTNALVNTISSHIENLIQGLRADYVYRLAVVYSHFPMNVSVKGNVVEINNFAGEKKARVAKIVPGAAVTVKGKEVIVKSSSKDAAGQTAANIENVTRVKGKDKRIYQDGIFIVEKAVQELKESS